MKKRIYIIALIVASVGVKGQQLGMYNHYFYKPLFYNPAFSGSSNETEAMLLNRSQWTGFSNGPQLNIFTIDGAVKEKKIGIGLNLVSDKRGINKRVGGALSYAYRLNINDDIHILLGLSAGVVNQSIDYSKVISESANDPTLFSTSQQKTTFDGNVGFVFVWKALELAASAPQLFGNKINYLDNSSLIRASYRQERHYISSLKYKFALSEEKEMFITPQFLARIIPNAPLQYDGNLTFSWKNKFWLGATYKSAYAVSANAGVSLNKCLDIGYSYEFITGNLAKYAGMSHEIIVNYRFGKGKKTEEPQANNENKNAEYEHKLDSIHTELEESNSKITENDKKIKELTAKLEQLSVQQQTQQANGGGGTNNYATNNNTGNNNNANQNNTGNNQTPTNNTAVKTSQNQDNNSNTNKNVTGSNTTSTNINNQSLGNPTNGLVEPGANKIMEDNVWIIVSNAVDYKKANGAKPEKGFYVVVGTFFYQDFAINEMKRFQSKGYKSSNWMYSNSKQYNYVFIKKAGTKQEAIATAKELQKSGVSDAWIKVLD